MKNKLMMLNLGCGKDIKKGFVNIDSFEHSNHKLDIKTDLAKKIPVTSNSADFAYSAHFLEHLDWIKADFFLKEVLRVLKKGGKLRILVPDYEKIFKNYAKGNKKFFIDIKNYLNNIDYKYYKKILSNRSLVKKQRIKNPPPKWHFSKKPEDVYKIRLRAKRFNTTMQVLNWFTHQHGEHFTLYDFETIIQILKKIGFKKIKKTSYKSTIDAKSNIRKLVSLCIEAYK